MKKLIAILAAGLGLLACTKEAPVAETATRSLKFNITVTRADTPDTKAVKTGWEDGDVVFVFFSEAAAPRYLEMKYNAATDSWTNTQKNGTTEEAFDLTSGNMLAVYMPYGSDVEVGRDDSWNCVFSKTYYSYYLQSELTPYRVEDDVVFGNLEMAVPEGFVHFSVKYIDATAAIAKTTTLSEAHVAPAALTGIGRGFTGLSFTKQNVRNYGDAMPAFYYTDGTDNYYLFSGILDEEARGVATAYQFHIDVGYGSEEEIRATVSGTKTLYTETSRALKLPDAESILWHMDESIQAVDLGLSVKWSIKNLGADSPLADRPDYFAWADTEPNYSSYNSSTGHTWKNTESMGFNWYSYRFYSDFSSGEGVFQTDEPKYSITAYQRRDNELGSYWYFYDGDDSIPGVDRFQGDGCTELKDKNYIHDAARARWEGSWRVPTAEEWSELLDNTEFSYDSENYIMKLTSTVPGYEGYFLLFKSTGMYDGMNKNTGQSCNLGGSGYYWTATLADKTWNAQYARIGVSEAKLFTEGTLRCRGLAIRPVCD